MDGDETELGEDGPAFGKNRPTLDEDGAALDELDSCPDK